MSQGKQSPHYYGGQAVVEGVMMRGASTWAVAVRRPEGDIYLERHPVSDFSKRYPLFRKPMFRGMFGLIDALRIGMKALTVSADQQLTEEERARGNTLGAGSLAVALLMFVGIFIVLPNAGLALASNSLGDGVVYHLVEGVVRIAIFLGYLAAISLLADIRRVFAYHGAEHMTIAAWEHGEVLEPSSVRKYSTLHVRCGTNFLLMVMLIAIITYSAAGAVVPAPEGGAVVTTIYHVALRVLLLPVVAGLAYEGLRLGAGRDNVLVRAMMKPGLWLQMITTKPPTDDMIEVAVRSFEAVAPADELAGNGQGPRIAGNLDSPLVWGPGQDRGPATDNGQAGPSDVTGAPIGRPDEEPSAGF
ncbi:MAG: DUF1385 domain-containing protein [Nitriliruptorales bacterium]|nr:DUF1385 domain-containing protein [Nitriliruptorales bacterium]